MITIDVPACMALGAAVALTRTHDSVSSQRFRTLGVTLFGFTPLAHSFDLYFHDWEWQYVAPVIPPVASMLFIIAMNAMGLATFEVVSRLVAAGKKRAGRAIFWGILAAIILYIAAAFSRVFWVGTYSEWSSGQASFMFSRGDFMGLLTITGSYLAISVYAWIFFSSTRSAQRGPTAM